MKKYKIELFPEYIFYFDGNNLKVYSLFLKRPLKKYWSELRKYYRYKLKTRFGHRLQLSERQIKHWITQKGVEIEEKNLC